MRIRLGKEGGGASIRLSAAVLRTARLKPGMVVNVHARDGAITLRPAGAPRYDLEALIAGITPENLYEEVDFRLPVGKEFF
jgi:antitoxin MazE